LDAIRLPSKSLSKASNSKVDGIDIWTPGVAHTLHDQHLISLGSWHSGEALNRQPPAPPRQYRLSRRLLRRLVNEQRVPLLCDIVDEAIDTSFGGVVVVHNLVGNPRW
jgi:hypothetical protein